MWCGRNECLFTWCGTDGGPDSRLCVQLVFCSQRELSGTLVLLLCGPPYYTHTPTWTHTPDTESYGCERCVLNKVQKSWGKNYLCNIFNGDCALWAATQAIIPHTGLLLHHTLQPIKFIFYLKIIPTHQSNGIPVLCRSLFPHWFVFHLALCLTLMLLGHDFLAQTLLKSDKNRFIFFTCYVGAICILKGIFMISKVLTIHLIVRSDAPRMLPFLELGSRSCVFSVFVRACFILLLRALKHVHDCLKLSWLLLHHNIP